MIACGKPLTQDKQIVTVEGRSELRPIGEFERYVQRQQLTCPTGSECPASLALLMFYDESDNKVHHCTGFLIDNEILVTAAQCLPQKLQQKDNLAPVNCENRIYALFAADDFSDSTLVGCDQILRASNLNNQENPALIKNSLALIKLNQKIFRRLAIAAQGIATASDRFNLWTTKSIDRDYHEINRQTCAQVYGSYAHPLVINERTPNLLLAGCMVDDQMRGGMYADNLGRAYAVAFSGANRRVLDHIPNSPLFDGPLNKLTHASSLLCTNQLYGRNFVVPDFCGVNWTEELYQQAQLKIRTDRSIHDRLFQSLTDQFIGDSELHRHVRWVQRFYAISNENSYRTEMEPECFVNTDQWLRKMRKKKKFVLDVNETYTEILLRMNGSLIPVSRTRSAGPIVYSRQIEFSPRELYRTGQSYFKYRGQDIRRKLAICDDY